MNLVIIYGPPASGKLTIATKLAKLTGYSLFHSHLTRDLVYDLYPDDFKNDNKRHYDLVSRLRCEIFKYCSEKETNLIFTYVYEAPEKDEILKELIDSIDKNKDKVLFVELVAPHEVLLDRVANESRKKYRKLVDKELYSTFLKTKNYASVPYDSVLRIDTSVSDVTQSAKQIVEYYKLRTISR